MNEELALRAVLALESMTALTELIRRTAPRS